MLLPRLRLNGGPGDGAPGDVVRTLMDEKTLFTIEGPDVEGLVWVVSAGTANPWSHKLGSTDRVAEALSQWLGSNDHREN